MTISIVYLFYSLAIKSPNALFPCFAFTSISHTATAVVAEVFEQEVGTNDLLRPRHPELFYQSIQSRGNNSLQCQAELQTHNPVFNRHAKATTGFPSRNNLCIFIRASLSMEAAL